MYTDQADLTISRRSAEAVEVEIGMEESTVEQTTIETTQETMGSQQSLPLGI